MTGTLPQLQVAVRQIMDLSLGNIARHLAAKTASAAVNASSSSPVDQHPQQQSYGNSYSTSYTNGGAATQETGYAQQSNNYATSASFAYAEPQNSGMSYSSGNHFDTAAYASGDHKPNMEAQLTAHNAQANHMGQSDFMASFAQPHTHTQVGNAFSSPPAAAAMNGSAGGVFQNAGPAAWRSFADNMMMNMHHEQQPHDYTASLMALGGTSRGDQMSNTGMENIAATMGSMLHVPMGREYEHHAQIWPLIQFSGSMTGQ